MTHEERLEKFGTWPSPPFTDKDSYLAWVTTWKERYMRLSAYIRQSRQSSIRYSVEDRAANAAGLSWAARQAGMMGDAQRKAVEQFKAQFTAELSPHKRAILEAEPVKIDGFRTWCSADAKRWTTEQVATGMLYDRHRAKATSWEMAKHLRAAQVQAR
jgi:hypothetical protein